MSSSSKVGPWQHLPKVATLESLLSSRRHIDMEVGFACQGVLAPPTSPCLNLLVLHRSKSLLQPVRCNGHGLDAVKQTASAHIFPTCIKSMQCL